MLYEITKLLSYLAFQVYFRKVYFSNRELVPDEGPKIFAVNHPTAFLDPALIASFYKYSLYFILRGDFFSSPLRRLLLVALHNIPIFRLRDKKGFSGLRKNPKSMDYAIRTLNEGKHILILPEGVVRHEKRLRPLQKGGARMAFGVYEKYGNDSVRIIPVGISYTNSDRFRSEVMVEFGEPVCVKDYLEIYGKEERRAVEKMTREVERRMQKQIVHIENPEDDEVVNQVLEMNRNNRTESIFPLVVEDDSPLSEEKDLANRINVMDKQGKGNLKDALRQYYRHLERFGLDDLALAKQKGHLFLLAGFVPFLIGYLLNYPPLRLAVFIADKRVKRIEFHASVRFAVGMVGYVLYFVIWLAAAFILGNGYLIALVFAMPFLGFFSLIYKEAYVKFKKENRFRQLDENAQNRLRTIREEVFQILARTQQKGFTRRHQGTTKEGGMH